MPEVPPPQGAIVGQDYSAAPDGHGWNYAVHLEMSWPASFRPGSDTARTKENLTALRRLAGTYHFTVAVADSSIPQLELQREFNIQVIEGMTVNWQDAPAVHGNKLSGSAVVSNQTGDEFVSDGDRRRRQPDWPGDGVGLSALQNPGR